MNAGGISVGFRVPGTVQAQEVRPGWARDTIARASSRITPNRGFSTPCRKVAIPVPDSYTWEQFLDQVRALAARWCCSVVRLQLVPVQQHRLTTPDPLLSGQGTAAADGHPGHLPGIGVWPCLWRGWLEGLACGANRLQPQRWGSRACCTVRWREHACSDKDGFEVKMGCGSWLT